MRPNGQDRRRLTNNHVPDTQPDWAPGGNRLTFVRNGDEIWTMGASGGNASSAASGRSPAWAPDGRLVAFVSSADGAIHTVRPTGADDTLLGDPVDHGSVSNSTGSLGSPKLSADSVDRGTLSTHWQFA